MATHNEVAELKKKALAYLQTHYPRIEAGRFKSISELRLPLEISQHAVVQFTFTDKATIKRWAFKGRDRPAFVEAYTDFYTVRIRGDGQVVGVNERHLSDKEVQAQMLRATPGDRILTLPKSAVANYWD